MLRRLLVFCIRADGLLCPIGLGLWLVYFVVSLLLVTPFLFGAEVNPVVLRAMFVLELMKGLLLAYVGLSFLVHFLTKEGLPNNISIVLGALVFLLPAGASLWGLTAGGQIIAVPLVQLVLLMLAGAFTGAEKMLRELNF